MKTGLFLQARDTALQPRDYPLHVRPHHASQRGWIAVRCQNQRYATNLIRLQSVSVQSLLNDCKS